MKPSELFCFEHTKNFAALLFFLAACNKELQRACAAIRIAKFAGFKWPQRTTRTQVFKPKNINKFQRAIMTDFSHMMQKMKATRICYPTIAWRLQTGWARDSLFCITYTLENSPFSVLYYVTIGCYIDSRFFRARLHKASTSPLGLCTLC